VERRLGIAGGHRGGMPAFALDTGDKAGIIAYLRNMNTSEATAVRTSDAARERAAFTGKGSAATVIALARRDHIPVRPLSGKVFRVRDGRSAGGSKAPPGCKPGA